MFIQTSCINIIRAWFSLVEEELICCCVCYVLQPCREDVRRESPGNGGSCREGQVQRSRPQLPDRQVGGGAASSAQPQSQSTSGPKQLSSSSELAALAPKLLTLTEKEKKKSDVGFPTQCDASPVSSARDGTTKAAREHCVEMQTEEAD